MRDPCMRLTALPHRGLAKRQKGLVSPYVTPFIAKFDSEELKRVGARSSLAVAYRPDFEPGIAEEEGIRVKGGPDAEGLLR